MTMTDQQDRPTLEDALRTLAGAFGKTLPTGIADFVSKVDDKVKEKEKERQDPIGPVQVTRFRSLRRGDTAYLLLLGNWVWAPVVRDARPATLSESRHVVVIGRPDDGTEWADRFGPATARPATERSDTLVMIRPRT
jgi:hypothetical protein